MGTSEEKDILERILNIHMLVALICCSFAQYIQF